MIRKEISVEYAVRRLRDEIDGGLMKKIRFGAKLAYSFILFVLKLCVAWFVTGIVGVIFGLNAALIALSLLLAWLLVPRAWRLTAFVYRRLKGRKGIAIGTSYPRIIEQYANVDAAPRRSASVVDVAGNSGPYYVDYGSEPNPHVLLVGSTSSGKTTATKSFICRNYLEYGTRFLMIDWNGDNETWANDCGAALWKVPENFRINMFRLNGMNPEQRASMVEDALLIAGRMTMLQATKIKNIALRHYLAGSEPTLNGIMEELARDGRRNSLITYRLSAIWRVIGDEPEIFWKSIFENNTIISLAGLNESEKAVVAYFILQRICELFEKEKPGAKERLLVVVDEAWQLLNSASRLGMHESLAEKVVRVGRRYGFGIMTSTQQLNDVPESFINSSALIMLHNYRQLYQNRLALSQFDLAYLAGANQGECLIFDRLRAQNGQAWPDYVKIRELDYNEYNDMKSRAAVFEVPSTNGDQQMKMPEMPRNIPEATATRKNPFKIPDGAPSPVEHAALLAIYYCKDRTKAGLIQYIKDKAWIKSPTTLYGYTGRPGVLDVVLNSGFAVRTKDTYELTELGRKWVDSEHVLANQSDKLGSEEHRRLLINTIHKLHESNMLVVTSSIKHSPDLVAWPVHEKKRYLWDIREVNGYEAQTSARKDSVSINESKAIRWNVPIVWVSNNDGVLEEIEKHNNESNQQVF